MVYCYILMWIKHFRQMLFRFSEHPWMESRNDGGESSNYIPDLTVRESTGGPWPSSAMSEWYSESIFSRSAQVAAGRDDSAAAEDVVGVEGEREPSSLTSPHPPPDPPLLFTLQSDVMWPAPPQIAHMIVLVTIFSACDSILNLLLRYN